MGLSLLFSGEFLTLILISSLFGLYQGQMLATCLYALFLKSGRMGGALGFCLYTIHSKNVSQIWQAMASKVLENVHARQGFSLPDATGGNGV
jgi:hypothetical protein